MGSCSPSGQFLCGTDESSVQLQCHKRFYCRKLKKGEQPRPKPRAKHPVKVHVWAGIGWHGATKICIFDDVWMLLAMYVSVALLPTPQLPEYEKGYRFMQAMIQNTPQE